jgi:hypothetical protein
MRDVPAEDPGLDSEDMEEQAVGARSAGSETPSDGCPALRGMHNALAGIGSEGLRLVLVERPLRAS